MWVKASLPQLFAAYSCKTVIIRRHIGNRNAYEYFRREGREELRKEVHAAFDRLAARYNPVVMEGAGSISEINLRDSDLVNLPMAMHAGADVILVADIDRGGVFASVYGSVMLLRPEERKHIKGILINKFRGDIRLFESGVKMLEDLCGVPVVGVVPYYKDIYIEEEDSVMLQTKNIRAGQGKVNEIHMGTTTPLADVPVSPLNHLADGREDGYFVDRTCMGTYVHGILDNPSVIDYLLEPFADKLKETAFDYKAFKEEQYDKLAAHVRKHVDLPLIYQILTDND